MEKWLDNNYILMCSTHNERKTVVAERFIKLLNGKIYKKLIANNSKSYLGYLNKGFNLLHKLSSNPTRGLSEIHYGKDLGQWPRLDIRLNVCRRSTILEK